MADACTIIGTRLDYAGSAEALRALATERDLAIEVSGRGAWTGIALRGHRRATLRFSGLRRRRPGDKFSGTVLGLLTLFRDVRTRAARAKRRVLQHVTEAEFIIGVVGEPSFSADDAFYDCIFAATEAVGGLIFNGSAMLNCDGHLILGADGSTETG